MNYPLHYELLSTDRLIMLHEPDSIWLMVIDEIEARLKGNLKLLMYVIAEAMWY